MSQKQIVKTHNQKKLQSEKLDEWLEKKSESKESDEEKKPTQTTGGQGAGESGLPTEITSLTNDQMDTAIKGITDSEARERDYCELPNVDLRKLIIPYQKFIRDIMFMIVNTIMIVIVNNKSVRQN